MGKTRTPTQPVPSKAQAPKSHRYYKGRPVYTLEQAADPNFVFPFPPEPEWEAEWHRRKAQHAKK